MRRILAVLATATLLSAPSAARPGGGALWEVLPEASRVSFGYLRGGSPVEGVFARFHGSGNFDPVEPEATRFRLAIESASIDLGEPVESAFATSAEWFDSEHFPEVVFVLNRLLPEGGNDFTATGELTIRGTTATVTAPVTLSIEGGEAHASGEVPLLRRDFLLGVGPSELFLDIGNRVSVRFELTARCLC